MFAWCAGASGTRGVMMFSGKDDDEYMKCATSVLFVNVLMNRALHQVNTRPMGDAESARIVSEGWWFAWHEASP